MQAHRRGCGRRVRKTWRTPCHEEGCGRRFLFPPVLYTARLSTLIAACLPSVNAAVVFKCYSRGIPSEKSTPPALEIAHSVATCSRLCLGARHTAAGEDRDDRGP